MTGKRMENVQEQRTNPDLPPDPSTYDCEVFLASVIRDQGNRQLWTTGRELAERYNLTTRQQQRVTHYLRSNVKYNHRGNLQLVRVLNCKKTRISGLSVKEYLIGPRNTYMYKK